MSEQKQQIIEDIVSHIHKNGKQQITGPVLQGVLVNMTEGLAAEDELSGKQDTLVSGTNIKTINGESVLGEGDITIVSSTNADWAENDPESPSYISNRTHYEVEENGYLSQLIQDYISIYGDGDNWSIKNHIGELTITPTDTGDPESAIQTDVPYKLFMVELMASTIPVVAKYKCTFKYGIGSLLFVGINVIYEMTPGPIMPGKPITYIPVVTEIYSDKDEDDVNVVDTIVGDVYYPKKLDNRFLNIDKNVQSNSDYPVTSGAVYDALQGAAPLSFHVDTSDTEHVTVDDEYIAIEGGTAFENFISELTPLLTTEIVPELHVTIDDDPTTQSFKLAIKEHYEEEGIGVWYCSFLNIEYNPEVMDLYNAVQLEIGEENGVTIAGMYIINLNSKNYLEVPKDTHLSESVVDIVGDDGYSSTYNWIPPEYADLRIPTCEQINKAICHYVPKTTSELDSGYKWYTDEVLYNIINSPLLRINGRLRVYFRVPFLSSELQAVINDNLPDPESGHNWIHVCTFADNVELLILYRRPSDAEYAYLLKRVVVS